MIKCSVVLTTLWFLFCGLAAPALGRPAPVAPTPPYSVKDLGLAGDDYPPTFEDAVKSDPTAKGSGGAGAGVTQPSPTPSVPRKAVGCFTRQRPGTSGYGDPFPCVFEAKETQELESFGLGGCALGINDGGDVVGYRYEVQEQPVGDFGVMPGVTQAAFWTGTRERDLWGPSAHNDFPDPSDITNRAGSRAFAINNKGVAVGEWYERAVLWDGPTGQDLNALIPSRPNSSWLLTSARRIDDQGRIITAAREALNRGRRLGAKHWLLLTPVPPPAITPPAPSP